MIQQNDPEHPNLESPIDSPTLQPKQKNNSSSDNPNKAGHVSEDANETILDSNNYNPFNLKYSQPWTTLAPILTMKYCTLIKDVLYVDLKFMRDKFKNNLNNDRVHNLVAFDKAALLKASSYISEAINKDTNEEIRDANKSLEKNCEDMAVLVRSVTELRKLINKVKPQKEVNYLE